MDDLLDPLKDRVVKAVPIPMARLLSTSALFTRGDNPN